MILGRSKTQFENFPISVPTKFASIWASFMLITLYLDYFHFYMPNSLTDMIAGLVFAFDISEAFLLAVMGMVSNPALMIFLSVGLPAMISRWVNIVIVGITIPLLLFNLAGEAWAHLLVGAGIQMVLLGFILY